MPSPFEPLRQWRRRHRRALRRAGAYVALLFALYLLAANVFLNTSLAGLAFNQKPERFHIQWSSAFSLYPGHIHARGIRVGGHARTTLWSASSAGADGRIKLLPLLARRLSFGTIHAREVEVGVDRVAADLPPSVPRSAAALARGPWKLHFDGITTSSLQRIRVGDWVVEGTGHARFGLDKVLRGGPVEVTPSTLRMPAARVRRGKLVLAREASLQLDMQMAPNTRRQAQGYEKVRFVDARLRLDGRAPGLGVTEGAQGQLALGSSGQDGRVQVDVVVSRGALQPGGKLHWHAPVTLDSASGAAHGYRLQVDAEVLTEGLAVHARVPRRPGREDQIDLRLQVAERRVLRIEPKALLPKASGTVRGRWHFATLRWLNPLLSDGWLRLDGAADVVADLRLRDGRLQPGSHAEVLDARVDADVFDTIATGQATAHATVEAQGRTRLDFLARDFALAPRTSPGQPYVRGRDLSLVLTASGELSEFRRTMQARARFAGARIPDLRAYNRSLPAGSLQFQGGSGTLGADLSLDAQGQLRHGQVHLRGQRADVRFGPSRVVGDVSLDSRLVGATGGPRRFRIESLRLGLDRVQVGTATGDGAWWARLDFEDGQLDWQQPISLRGNARVAMKDVSALLDLYADRSAFPGWVARLVDEGRADATARIRLDGDALAIDRLKARNERIELDAHLRLAQGQARGALYARWGVLGLGAETSDGQRKLHLLRARQWYDGLPAANTVP